MTRAISRALTPHWPVQATGTKCSDYVVSLDQVYYAP